MGRCGCVLQIFLTSSYKSNYIVLIGSNQIFNVKQKINKWNELKWNKHFYAYNFTANLSSKTIKAIHDFPPTAGLLQTAENILLISLNSIIYIMHIMFPIHSIKYLNKELVLYETSKLGLLFQQMDVVFNYLCWP